MNQRKIKIVLIGISTLVILNFIIFICVFYNQDISKSVSDWANFADYISGTTNILISIMSLLVTLFIAYEISHLDEKRNNANLEYDKKKFKRELREKEYYEITENLNNFWFAITNENRNSAKNDLYVIRQKFVCFIKYRKHLFPELNPNQFEKLDKTLVEIMKIMSVALDVDNPESIELVDKFQKEVSLFHIKMQEYIIKE